jgi:AcrR family transcriptional regulator
MAWTRKGIEEQFDLFTVPDETDDPRLRRKKRIVDEATELFVVQGYRRTSVDQIARRAGVAKGTVYLHFSSKAEIAVHAIVAEKRRYFDMIAPCFEQDGDPREKLRLLIRGGLVMATVMPMTSRLVSGDREFLDLWDELPSDFMQERQAWGHDFYVDFLAEATPQRRWREGELGQWARVLMMLMYFSSFVADERIRGDLSVERTAEILSDMIVDGIDGPPHGGGERGGRE